MDVQVDLSEFAGSSTNLGLVNGTSSGEFEAGYWAKIEIVTE